MTLEEAQAEVDRIAASAGDYEGAHGMEDDFREKVLRVIENVALNEGNVYLQRLAATALKTSDIEFKRYCA